MEQPKLGERQPDILEADLADAGRQRGRDMAGASGTVRSLRVSMKMKSSSAMAVVPVIPDHEALCVVESGAVAEAFAHERHDGVDCSAPVILRPEAGRRRPRGLPISVI
jgi:hypothetical protein